MSMQMYVVLQDGTEVRMLKSSTEEALLWLIRNSRIIRHLEIETVPAEEIRQGRLGAK